MSVDPLIVELRKMRRDSELSQDAIAAAIGVWPSQISQYESGARRPKLNIMGKWAETLGCEIILQRKVPS
jgi:transcriptional regulator with XRE-family HTH domain